MGMFQRKQNRIQEQEKSKDSGLLAEVDKLEQEPVITTRIVKLKLITGCGCGGSHDKITREVSLDSDLNDGDYVYNQEPSDKPGW
jgi:Ser-tRNA(Ala) deacylase AlaX